jgi:hypothetical protein
MYERLFSCSWRPDEKAALILAALQDEIKHIFLVPIADETPRFASQVSNDRERRFRTIDFQVIQCC